MCENMHYVDFLIELRTRAFLQLRELERQGIVLPHRKRKGYAVVGRLGTVLVNLGSWLEGLAMNEERMVVDV